MALNNCFDEPYRKIGISVFLDPSNDLKTYSKLWMENDKVISLTLERVGAEDKFFGYGFAQKINLKLIDKERELDLKTSNTLAFRFFEMTQYKTMRCAPIFKISQVHRDELTNNLSITAYDAIYQAAAHTVSELNLTGELSIKDYVVAASSLLGLNGEPILPTEAPFETLIYEGGANLEGTENLRAILDAAAEATQTIYYINTNNQLVFVRMDKDGEPIKTIGKDLYYSLDSGDNRRLAAICSTTQLEDSVTAKLPSFKIIKHPDSVITGANLMVNLEVTATGQGLTYKWIYSVDGGSSWMNSTSSGSTRRVLTISAKNYMDGYLYKCEVTNSEGIKLTSEQAKLKVLPGMSVTTYIEGKTETPSYITGTTQYIRDNPFLEMREDVADILEDAIADVGGFTINQFDCEWRGNPALNIGDKIALITKDDKTVYSYLLNDTLTYDGALKQRTKWKYSNEEGETESNPSTLGEALNQTYARVNKVDKQVDIVAGEASANRDSIAAIQMKTESIVSSVKKIEERTNEALEKVEEEIETLTKWVEAAMDSESLRILIQQELINGVDKVYTSTGFSFDAEGLKVSKTGSEMETLLDEDGLKIYRDNTEVLTVDNTGVNGLNMTIRQYLIVGGSRFEAYGSDRTGCFWVGG